MVEDREVSFSLEVNVEQGHTALRRLYTVGYRVLGLLRRLGLPPEADAFLMKVQQMISAANSLRLTLNALQTASGPLGWAMLGISAITTAWTFSDVMMGVEGY